MIIFTRNKDMAGYIQLLSSALQMMARDMVRIYKLVGYDCTEEEIISSYFQTASGPTAIETILIKQGKLTEDETRVNNLAELIYELLKLAIQNEQSSEKESGG
ncbi:MAG: hypothetical protein K2O18_07215 [Oscillospiraceae bacterium]|nr:hypothetical protein [Oscillospiraceae bacterium]